MPMIDKSDSLSRLIAIRFQDFMRHITKKILSHEADEIGKTKAT